MGFHDPHQVIKSKNNKELFLLDKLMINKLHTLHLRYKKHFLRISKDPLDKKFSFLASSFAFHFFLIIWCKNEETPPTQCLIIVSLLMEGASFCNNRDENVMIYATFLLV